MTTTSYWGLIALFPALIFIAFLFGKQYGFQRGVKSQEERIRDLTQLKRELLARKTDLLSEIAQLQSRLAESGEWIEVPVILHGLSWSNAAHTFVQLHTKTLELRASRMTSTVKGEPYSFDHMPKPVLGGPKWQHIQGSNDEILLLGQVYRWS